VQRTNKYCLSVLFLMSSLIVTGTVVAADFQFNFNSHGGIVPGGSNVQGSFADGNDGTRFFQDVVDINGVSYFHVVVGDPATGFAMESYTTKSTGGLGSSSSTRPGSPDSGGNERALIGEFGTNQSQISSWAGRQFGNAKDPLGTILFTSPTDPGTPLPVDQRFNLSGNGTMNPSRMVMKMVLSGDGMSLEFDKPILARKPKISQSLSSENMSMQNVIDMRGLKYDEMDEAAPMSLVLNLNEPDLPVAGAANFDLQQMGQKTEVNAGRYIFTPGAGWNSFFGWDSTASSFDEGTYTYADGNFDVLLTEWDKFFDNSQNAAACSSGYRQYSVCPGQ